MVRFTCIINWSGNDEHWHRVRILVIVRRHALYVCGTSGASRWGPVHRPKYSTIALVAHRRRAASHFGAVVPQTLGCRTVTMGTKRVRHLISKEHNTASSTTLRLVLIVVNVVDPEHSHKNMRYRWNWKEAQTSFISSCDNCIAILSLSINNVNWWWWYWYYLVESALAYVYQVAYTKECQTTSKYILNGT